LGRRGKSVKSGIEETEIYSYRCFPLLPASRLSVVNASVLIVSFQNDSREYGKNGKEESGNEANDTPKAKRLLKTSFPPPRLPGKKTARSAFEKVYSRRF
jgi:hypothetical protein